mgnify:CR=1 FL=1
MTVLETYLRERYSDGGADSDRFEPDPEEIHASQIGDCERKRWWKFRRQPEPGADAWPYFELGHTLELTYGAALAVSHDDLPGSLVESGSPRQIVDASSAVEQDVNVTIEREGHEITGESDWVVFDSEPVDEVVVDADGEAMWRRGAETGEWSPGMAEKVIETKTTGNMDWKRRNGPSPSHRYQIYPYMRALSSPGEIVYVGRDALDELVYEEPLSRAFWFDVDMRAARHAENYSRDDPPDATPLNESECKFCPFADECAELGGSPYL